MIHPANKILRRRAQGTRRRWAVIVSVAMHSVVIVLGFLVPYLIAQSRPPIEFRTVTIVPLQARGVPSPEPRPEPERPAPPEPPRPTPPKEEPRQSAPSPQATQKAEPRATTPAVPEPRQRRGSPLGSDLASSPFGAAGVGLDNPDFTYGYYIDQLLSMIGGQWSRPRVDGRPESLLFFRIQRDGSVTDLRLVETSGVPAFDEAALSAVRRAAPLPPLPASYDRDSLGVSLVVR